MLDCGGVMVCFVYGWYLVIVGGICLVYSVECLFNEENVNEIVG